MERLRFIIPLMMIMLTNAMANAKLTIAVVDSEYYNSIGRFFNYSKFRQAYIDIYDEKAYKDLLCNDVFVNKGNWMALFGNDGRLIIRCPQPRDKDFLIRMKKIFDYMSEKGDTLYSTKSYTYNLSDILDKRWMQRMLIIGQDYTSDLKMNLFLMGLAGSVDRPAYEQACKKLSYNHIEDIKEDIIQKNVELYERDFEFFYKYMRNMDKILLSLHMGPTEIYDFFSYEYDENAQVRYIEQEFIHY